MTSHPPQASPAPDQQAPEPSNAQGMHDSAPAAPSLPGFREPSEQDAARIPGAVGGVAEAAGLGRPIRAYTRGQPPGQRLILALLENADLWLGMLGFWVLCILLILLLYVWVPLNLTIVGMLLLALGPLALLIVQARVAVHRQRRRSAFCAWSCPGGLVYTQDGHYHALRWEQIEVVIRNIIPLNDVHATAGFQVLPSGAPPFAFALLQGPFAAHLQSPGKKRAFTLTVSNAEQAIRVGADGSMEVSGKIDLSAYTGLGELIEAQMISQHWPRVLAAYRSGASITFGPLVVTQQGVQHGVERLGWENLAGVTIAEGNLHLIRKPYHQLWAELPAWTIPNLALLLTLLHRIESGERALL